ncbi:MAG: hypothetical protein K6T57_15180, partial [Thermaceae bacterium]|nr:hypothetical protein [Thermaceae bacterium]
MGYTHYWRRPRQLKLETFRRFVHDVGVLLHHLPLRTNGAGGFYSQRLLVVCGAWGNGAPTLSEQEVAFNGDAAEELDHETFAVERVYCPAPWE